MNNTPNVGNSDFNTGSSNRNDNNTLYSEPRLGENYDRRQRLNIDESNKGNYNSNNYENVFNKLNISHDVVDYSKRNHFLTVSSKDRDITVYPKSSKFVLDLDEEYRNVLSVELIQAIIPDQNNVTSEPFLLLNIKELDAVMESNNKQIYDSFSILQIAPPVTTGGFIYTMKQIHEHTILQYRTPKARLSRLSISVTDSDGDIFGFGGDGATTKDFQCHFIFKIVTSETDRRLLGQQNVYH